MIDNVGISVVVVNDCSNYCNSKQFAKRVIEEPCININKKFMTCTCGVF